jgi:hypothetical protein
VTDSSTKEAVAEQPTTVPDLRGNPVAVGDTIVYGATDGRSAGMRIGKVTEIVWAHEKMDYAWSYSTKVPTKLRVEVEISSGFWAPSKPVLIEAGFKRFVKLD